MNLITRDELRAKLDRGERFKLVMTLSAHAYSAKRIDRKNCYNQL